jgi:hypothetical protein
MQETCFGCGDVNAFCTCMVFVYPSKVQSNVYLHEENIFLQSLEADVDCWQNEIGIKDGDKNCRRSAEELLSSASQRTKPCQVSSCIPYAQNWCSIQTVFASESCSKSALEVATKTFQDPGLAGIPLHQDRFIVQEIFKRPMSTPKLLSSSFENCGISAEMDIKWTEFETPASTKCSTNFSSEVLVCLKKLRRELECMARPVCHQVSKIEDRAIASVMAAAALYRGGSAELENSEAFDAFIRSSADLIEIDQTVLFLKSIQDLCRQVLKMRNPTNLRGRSPSLTSKASKFARLFVIKMRKGFYDHVLNRLKNGTEWAANGRERERSGCRKDFLIQNTGNRELFGGCARKIFANAKSQALREAVTILSQRRSSMGRRLASNHLSAAVTEKMFQLYFKHTGALYEEIVEALRDEMNCTSNRTIEGM